MREKKEVRLSYILVEWYKKHKRELPWRDTSDPYIIWISEIILQQTRVNQGYEYFNRFVKRFPTVSLLASADEDEVLKLWQGLGYYSRARNLHAASKQIMDEYDGVFPRKYKDILNLKGVGEYTAAAIVSFAYNDPYAVVDGNVYRVLSRVFAESKPIDTGRGKKLFAELAFSQLDDDNPGLHNQAIMEFGALQCVPVSPNCQICPASLMCLAYSQNKVGLFPVKEGRQKVRSRYFHYFDIHDGDYMFLHKRMGKDIWQNLYEFPLIETEEEVSLDDLLSKNEFKALFGKCDAVHIKYVTKIKHILSHQIIYAAFYQVEIRNVLFGNDFLRIKKNEVDEFPVSRLIHKYLERE